MPKSIVKIRCLDQKRMAFNVCFVIIILITMGQFFPVSALADAEIMVHSSSLETVTTEEGNVERIDYVNDDGEITYAANKHYATLIKTKGDKTLLEEYYGADGEPSQQESGYYALLREYDDEGQNYKITYLGIDGKPVITQLGYAILVRTFNKEGLVVKELYYDTQSKPIETYLLGYGCCKEYNEDGRNTRIIYLNKNGEPAVYGQGFASMRRSYYETDPISGEVKTEFYFDENDNPIKLSHGQYGVYKEYDELRRCILLTYLDTEGRPVITEEGYTTVKRTFYEDDTVKTEEYFDINGNPISLQEGQYGLLHEDGKTTYLDADGKELFNLRNFLFNSRLSVIFICMAAVFLSGWGNRKVNLGLLLVYILFILYMTLSHRESTVARYNFELFWSYKEFFRDTNLRWEILNNILLFIPLGTILYQTYPDKKVLFIPIAMSVIIEGIQYITGTGLCEFDDVFSNALGGVLGYGAGIAMSNIPLMKRMKLKELIHRLKNQYK